MEMNTIDLIMLLVAWAAVVIGTVVMQRILPNNWIYPIYAYILAAMLTIARCLSSRQISIKTTLRVVYELMSSHELR